jgi:CheY-like chemotaxis protein
MDALRKVLVVDDDPVVGKSIDRVLTGKGYAVITASNGEEALAKLRDEKYDVVFTDIKMPGMSGLEVAERVKASQPWLPVVIVTGFGTGDYEARAAAAGVSGFLHKPLSPEMIEGSARKALLELDAALPTEPETAAIDDAAPAPAQPQSTAKNVALFFAAPFIGLAYMLAFPLVGLGMLAWMGAQSMMKYPAVKKFAAGFKTAGMIIAAPLIGLFFILTLPLVGLVMLVWTGAKAARK